MMRFRKVITLSMAALLLVSALSPYTFKHEASGLGTYTPNPMGFFLPGLHEDFYSFLLGMHPCLNTNDISWGHPPCGN